MQKFECLDPFSDSDKIDEVREELIRYRESRKELRPRSYTVYKLRYSEDSDGETVDTGSVSQEFNTYKGIEEGAMLFLNKKDTGYSSWDLGDYTVTVSFNKDRKFNESYYLNNQDGTLHFTITAKQKKANTLQVSRRTIKVSLKKLKKYGTVVRKNAVTVSKNKGTVKYQLKKITVKNKKNKFVKSAKYARKISINKKSGKVTIKKDLRNGIYKITVKVSAAGNADYKSKTKEVTFKMIVK